MTEKLSAKVRLPEAPTESVIYKDEWLCVCLALYPITKGHTVIIWNNESKDLHSLSDDEYDYLMEIMDIARDALLEILKVEKVYLIYMDEVEQVHWHLVPRYEEKGFNLLTHTPEKNSDFSLTSSLKIAFNERYNTRELRFPE